MYILNITIKRITFTDLVDLVADFLAGDFSPINSFNNQSTSPDSILDWLLFYRETPY